MNRIGKYQYYLNIAKSVAARSTCIRRQYGAVIVNGDEIISTGYNGTPRGEVNCCDVGTCWREENKVPHGERYEACRSVHAEQNAIISAARKDMLGATLFLVGLEDGKVIDAEPCEICRRMIANAGILNVVTSDSDFYGSEFVRSNDKEWARKRAEYLKKSCDFQVVRNDKEDVVLSVELQQECDDLVKKSDDKEERHGWYHCNGSIYKCSKCEKPSYCLRIYDFCPNCGAKMEFVKNEEG